MSFCFCYAKFADFKTVELGRHAQAPSGSPTGLAIACAGGTKREWPARQIISGILCLTSDVSLMIRQSTRKVLDVFNIILQSEFETTTMLFGGRGPTQAPSDSPTGLAFACAGGTKSERPARLIIDGLLYIMKITSQIIRQPNTLLWNVCKGVLYSEVETTPMTFGGRGHRKPPLTPPRGENHWPARLIIDGLLYIMKITSQIIRQPNTLLWNVCKGVLYSEVETTPMTFGGRGIGPGEGVGAGLVGGISWPRLFVSFWSQKERLKN